MEDLATLSGGRNLSCSLTAFLDWDVVYRMYSTTRTVLASGPDMSGEALCTSSVLTGFRGLAMSVRQAILGRFFAGMGGAGIVALISVIITGKRELSLQKQCHAVI